MNIFVGNLSFLATENDVKGVFEAFGAVSFVSIKKNPVRIHVVLVL